MAPVVEEGDEGRLEVLAGGLGSLLAHGPAQPLGRSVEKGLAIGEGSRVTWRDQINMPQSYWFGGAKNDKETPLKTANRLVIAERGKARLGHERSGKDLGKPEGAVARRGAIGRDVLS